MLAALGALAAVSTVLDAVTSLTPPSSASVTKTKTGFVPAAESFPATTIASTATTAPASGSGSTHGKLSPDMLNDLFALLDADGSGGISKSEFENALGAGGTNTAAADNVFAKMDTDGDGTVSSNELTSALSGSRRGHGHHHHAGNAASSAATSSYNDVEQAIQRQAQAITASTTASVSVSA